EDSGDALDLARPGLPGAHLAAPAAELPVLPQLFRLRGDGAAALRPRPGRLPDRAPPAAVPPLVRRGHRPRADDLGRAGLARAGEATAGRGARARPRRHGRHRPKDVHRVSFSDIIYPFEWLVAWIMYLWHEGLTMIGLPANNGWTWALAIVGLVVIMRAA